MKPNMTHPPVIILGQPRTGSSLLVKLLNESDDYIVIDDLYVMQYIDANNLWGQLDSESAKKIAEYAFNFISRRVIYKTAYKPDGTPEKILQLTKEHITEINDYLSNVDYSNFQWFQVVDDLLSNIAAVTGARGWGYKTPQDFLHLDRLAAAFPTAVFIFLLRDPRAMLASYKNRTKREYDRDRGGDDPRRYNPYLQSIAWQLAAKAGLRSQETMPDRTIVTTYEQLVRDPKSTLDTIGAMLRTTFPDVDLNLYDKNTSFKDKTGVSKVTDTEIWVSDFVVRDLRKRFGYDYQTPSPKFADVGAVGSIFFTSTVYYASRGLMSTNMRKRIFRVFQSAVSGRFNQSEKPS
jgi:Sulfotransferase family